MRMSRRKKQYPVKTTVNLVYRERPGITVPQMLLAAALFAVVFVVFGKYAVADRLAASGKALREAEKIEEALAVVQEGNVDYEDVLKEYQHYYFSATDTGDAAAAVYVNSMDVLELLEQELLNKAGVQMVNLTGNVMTVNLTRIDLEGASEIAKSLSANPLVRDVLVSAANKQQQEEGTTVFLNIVLEPAQSEENNGEGAA